MNAFSRFALLLVMVSTSSGPAAIISRDWKTPGDGLLTYDTVNKREWLEFSLTRLSEYSGATLESRFQQVVLKTAPGGEFEGFEVASLDGIRSFLLSAGLPLNADRTQINQQLYLPTKQFLTLLDTAVMNGVTLGYSTFGYLNQVNVGRPRGRQTAGVFYRDESSIPARGGVQLPYSDDSDVLYARNTHVYLVRAVPEPRNLSTSVISFVLLLGYLRYHSRKRETGSELFCSRSF